MTGRLSKTSGCTLHKMFMFESNTIAQLAKTRPQDKACPKSLKKALLPGPQKPEPLKPKALKPQTLKTQERSNLKTSNPKPQNPKTSIPEAQEP